ncbi:glycoside hydrolase family 15 protein [Noviherbaspirillum sp. 17J57-3]|uniref:Glycoside hydrolase family 15 protein n=2 Tax=Noviherbaspirillum galbum TaxID=2709383 RepID=A0A6B3SJK9_9BURK|nr:glycoside hydrolase family 15 protein [Noviherbaspirillum galbum]
MDARYPPIADYALLSDGCSTALVSRDGSIDWCCMPSMDADGCFSRLLDRRNGGHCQLAPAVPCVASRRYVGDSMVLETSFRAGEAEAKLTDFFAMPSGGRGPCRLVRILDGMRGDIEFQLELQPRFDYGSVVPHMSERGPGLFVAVGGNNGFVFRTDMPVQVDGRNGLRASFRVGKGARFCLSMEFHAPECIDDVAANRSVTPGSPDCDFARREQTLEAWHAWAARLAPIDGGAMDAATRRSALVLKALTFSRTGAIAAAPTTSLPEWPGGTRNWDYRYSWARDSVFAVRALYRLGCPSEAEAFMRFIQRSSAGSADELQIMYGLDGKRRLTEVELPWLEGYRGSKPVRIGNKASEQSQLDLFGEIMELAWTWHASGHPIDAAYWAFLRDVVDAACRRWQDPDSGIWEFRGEAAHHVHSKAMCWAAVDFGIRLARDGGFDAPLERWEGERDRIRRAIEEHGYDRRRGIFVQAFGRPGMDASLLLLPRIGFVAAGDPRMVRTVDAVIDALDHGGLLRRYDMPDGIPGPEGAFLPCTFWLAACLAEQQRPDLARAYYDRGLACRNDLGLFSEEYDPDAGLMLGNFPQGLTHVSQIMAWLAMMAARPLRRDPEPVPGPGAGGPHELPGDSSRRRLEQDD